MESGRNGPKPISMTANSFDLTSSECHECAGVDKIVGRFESRSTVLTEVPA